MLVDEATAALDPETSRHVNKSILDLDGLTRIVGTHDLDEGSLRRYNEIIVLKDGEIVEKDMSELMNCRGYFYSLYTVAQ